MMGAIVAPAAKDVAGLHDLLAVIADPAKAKSVLDEIQAAHEELATHDAATTAAAAEQTARNTAADAREAALKERDASVAAAAAALEKAREALLVDQAVNREARGKLEQISASHTAAAAKLADREAVVAQRELASETEVARLAQMRNELNAWKSALDTRQKALKKALNELAA